MGGRVQRLRDELAGLWELGHRALQQGDYPAAADLLGGIDRVMDRELPAAQVEARAAARERAAARAADPDAPRLRVADDAPMGWVADPEFRARMSPAVLDRIADHDHDAQVQADQAAAEVKARRRAERVEQWRSDVLDGLADPRIVPPDFDPTPDMVAAGKVTVAEVEEAIAERVAAFHGVQLQEDKKLDAAILDYGRMCAEVFGADGHEALRALLGGPDRVGARFGRERGTP
jgi:hypothetical protein